MYPACLAFDNLHVFGGYACAIIGIGYFETRARSGDACQPGDLRCDADALRECVQKAIADMFGSADVIFEFRLAKSGYAQRG